VAPESRTKAVDLPEAKQERTPPLHMKKLPTSNFSKISSVNFYLSSLSCKLGSLIKRGCSDDFIPSWLLKASLSKTSTREKS